MFLPFLIFGFLGWHFMLALFFSVLSTNDLDDLD